MCAILCYFANRMANLNTETLPFKYYTAMSWRGGGRLGISSREQWYFSKSPCFQCVWEDTVGKSTDVSPAIARRHPSKLGYSWQPKAAGDFLFLCHRLLSGSFILKSSQEIFKLMQHFLEPRLSCFSLNAVSHHHVLLGLLLKDVLLMKQWVKCPLSFL